MNSMLNLKYYLAIDAMLLLMKVFTDRPMEYLEPGIVNSIHMLFSDISKVLLLLFSDCNAHTHMKNSFSHYLKSNIYSKLIKKVAIRDLKHNHLFTQ